MSNWRTKDYGKAKVHLSCDPGQKITNIKFASFGTPQGTCGSFSEGKCHAHKSYDIFEKVNHYTMNHRFLDFVNYFMISHSNDRFFTEVYWGAILCCNCSAWGIWRGPVSWNNEECRSGGYLWIMALIHPIISKEGDQHFRFWCHTQLPPCSIIFPSADSRSCRNNNIKIGRRWMIFSLVWQPLKLETACWLYKRRLYGYWLVV